VAGKFGLRSAEPLLLFDVRFFLAGGLLLVYKAFLPGRNIPRGSEWTQLAIFGALNTTLYLGIFVIALQWITPGITTLAIALNPLLISTFSALWLRRGVTRREWISLFLGFGGLVTATYPLLDLNESTLPGLILLTISMVCYSMGAVYYASVRWELPRLSINAWQVLIGGLLLLPFTIVFHGPENTLDSTFWLSVLWLVLPVSIIAVQLWLRLLKSDAVKASLWLYLCPVFGFVYSAWLFGEDITMFTVVGTVCVLGALYLGQQRKS